MRTRCPGLDRQVNETVPALLLFPAGLIFGSFVTVVAHRVPLGMSIVGGRSRCPRCGNQIAAYDNIPLISWLLLRGRSRCCERPISGRYPATELALGALFAATALVLWEEPYRLALGLVLVSVLLAVTVTDLERRIIPNAILGFAGAIGVCVIAVAAPSELAERAISAVAGGGFLLAAAVAYPRGMGMGDVKLAAVMGLYLGRAVAPALLVALAAGASYGLVLIARDGAAARKRAIPFGPFLALGGLVGLLVGPEILDWYLDSFVR
jgi:leader peptidase (prepilin peptidase)/N-methyltransferase